MDVSNHPDFASLVDWVNSNVAAGAAEADMLQAGLAGGHDEALMRAVLQRVYHPIELVSSPTPWPNLTNGSIWVGDRTVRIAAVSEREPKWVLFENLLSLNEADQLVEEATPLLERSTGVDPITGVDGITEARTSSGMHFKRGQTPLVMRLEARIAELVNWPVINGEGLQVLRYGIGEEYIPHHDFFDPNFPGNVGFIGKAGNRVGTMLIYLQTPEEGGETLMADVDLKIFPQKGNALLFVYDRPSVTTLTHHAGMPVKVGTKMVATKWFREKAYA